MNGILNLDKPPGRTSAFMVERVKRLLPRGVKVGHAGTLDPFATGVLLILVGKGTKLCESLMDSPKQYETSIKLGATTETDDGDSPERPTAGARAVERGEIEAILPRFIGEIRQRPPAYSALKIGGTPAYKLARKGRTVAPAERTVRVYGIQLLEYEWPTLRLRVDCGRGTYIRAIGRDIGAALGVGGYLSALRRTRVGNFSAESAHKIENLTAASFPGVLADAGGFALSR